MARPDKGLGVLMQDPVWFFTHVLGVSYLTPDQVRIAESFRDNKRTAVPSGHGVGKTFLSATLVLWFLVTNYKSRVITTAPTWFQVENLLWREIAGLWSAAKYPLGGTCNKTSLEFDEKWVAIGISTTEATRFQGTHAPRVAVLFDEATGVPPYIWDAAESLAVGPDDRLFAVGNPTDPSSRFKAVCDSGNWHVIELSSEAHPNVVEGKSLIPGAVTREWCEERLKDYGGRETPLYRSRVLGKWPEQGDDTLISLAWVDAAVARWIEPTGYPRATGTDVARFGSDETVAILIYEGGTVGCPIVRQGQDTMATAGMIRSFGCTNNAVDDTGLGGGVTDRLAELGHPITPENFGESARDAARFVNRRSELWWNLREALQAGTMALPEDRRLMADLTNVKYSLDSSGRIKLEPKPDIKKRLGRSPDRGDALAIAWSAYSEGRALDTLTLPSGLRSGIGATF